MVITSKEKNCFVFEFHDIDKAWSYLQNKAPWTLI